MVAIASGRCTYGVEPTAKELCLDRLGGYILSYNGGQIINCKTKQIIENHYLPLNLIGKIFDFAANIFRAEPYLLTFVPPGIEKGNGLKIILNAIRFPGKPPSPSETVTTIFPCSNMPV